MVHRTAVNVSLLRNNIQRGEDVEGSIIPRSVPTQTHTFRDNDIVLGPRDVDRRRKEARNVTDEGVFNTQLNIIPRIDGRLGGGSGNTQNCVELCRSESDLIQITSIHRKTNHVRQSSLLTKLLMTLNA